MIRQKIAKLAQEAKKIKSAPLPPLSASAAARSKKRVGATHYRILESPACRRVALVGHKGCLDASAAESLLWKLQSWETNHLLQAILLQGRPGHAFSVGWNAGKDAGLDEKLASFRRYNQLSYLLATIRKPTISWFTGDVVGSGMGLGLTRYRVATEKSTFQAVGPDKGWILDGGLSYLLPRLRTNGNALDANSIRFARYLALTGASLSGLDMLASGLATHFMEDAVAGIMHKRLGDMTFEPDFMTESVVADHAAMYYKLDTQLNPPPYQELWPEWEKNDAARERLMKRASGGSGGDRYSSYDDEEAESYSGGDDEDEEQEPWNNRGEDDQENSWQKEEKSMGGHHDHPDVKDNTLAKTLLARHGGDLEEEDASSNSKNSQPLGSSETEGSLWWHRNFAKGDEALLKARWETIENRLSGVLGSDVLEAVNEVSEKFYDTFPEYVTYPERKRLVDADKMLLSPWNCTIDRKQEFPDFFELVEKVDRCFKGDSVEEVVAALGADGSPWATACLRRMGTMSSLSLKVMFKQLEEGKGMEIEETFRMDYRVGLRLLSSSSSPLPNGLEALATVPADQVAELFLPFASGEEELDLPERERLDEHAQLLPDLRSRYTDPDLQRRFGGTTTTRKSI